jgi:mRNA-degrading endonuclease RelE of RelBE toxin-antitoxin system
MKPLRRLNQFVQSCATNFNFPVFASIRTGDYRAIYEINDGRLVVTAIGHRREVYE